MTHFPKKLRTTINTAIIIFNLTAVVISSVTKENFKKCANINAGRQQQKMIRNNSTKISNDQNTSYIGQRNGKFQIINNYEWKLDQI